MSVGRNIFLKSLVKWHLKFSKDLFESAKIHQFKKTHQNELNLLTFDIVSSFIILHILDKEKKSKPDTDRIHGIRNERIRIDKLFKQNKKILKYFIEFQKIELFSLSKQLVLDFLEYIKVHNISDPLILNYYYEAILKINFQFKQGSLTFTFNNNQRKEQGSFFTPSNISDFIVKNYFSKDSGNLPPSGKPFKILDPSCGCGIFLYHCYSRLLEIYAGRKDRRNSLKAGQISLFLSEDSYKTGKFEDRKELLLNTIHGIDTDSKALQVTKIILSLKLLENEKEFLLDVRFFKKLGKNFSDRSFFGNAEIDKESPDYSPDFNRIISLKYDLIIGNPPWITIRKSEIGAKLWNDIRNRFKSVSVFKLNTYPVFIENAVKMLTGRTSVIFIVPQRILDAPSYSELRKELVQSKLINKIEILGKNVFENVVSDYVILHLDETKKEKLEIVRHEADLAANIVESVPYSEIDNESFRINVNRRSKYDTIISKIEPGSIHIKKLFNVHVGMMIRNKKELIKNSNHGLPVITSKCFSKFSIISPKFINFEKAEIFGGVKDPVKQNKFPKIIIKKTGSDIIATVDFLGIPVEQSCYFLLPLAEVDIYFFVALLNSTLLRLYYKLSLISNPSSYPYIQHYDLERLPLNVHTDGKKKTLIDQISMLSKKIFSIQSNSTGVKNLPKTIKKIETLIAQIDGLIYTLYGLTDDEISLTEDFLNAKLCTKQPET